MSNSPVAQPQRGTLAIERVGVMVRLEIVCDDTYSAMRLYDEAIASAQHGELELRVSLKGAKA